MSELLRNAIILDTETTSLRRGAGIHELAIYDINARSLLEYILDPNLVEVRSKIKQDISKLSSSPLDEHTMIQAKTWKDIIVHEIFAMNGIQGNDEALLESLRFTNPFLYKALHENTYPHLSGNKENLTGRIEAFNRMGIQASLGNQINMDKLLAEDLPNQIKGKMIWIANANFESKQIGAQVAARQLPEKIADEVLEKYKPGSTASPNTRRAAEEAYRASHASAFKENLNLATRNVRSPDPFYITGKEVNTARAIAQYTGDWSGVYEAYKKQIANNKGETMVGDILDLVRSNISKGRNLNIMSPGTHHFGTSIDITHRFMAAASGDIERAKFAEAHRAAEDAAIHEEYVLRKSIRYNEVLDHVKNQTPEGKEFIKASQKGKGEFHEILRYFSLLENNGAEFQRINLLKRFERAHQDLAAENVSVQTTGPSNIYHRELVGPDGPVQVPQVEYGKREFRNLNKVLEHIKNTGSYSDYGIDIDKEIDEFKMNSKSAESVSQYVNEQIEKSAARIDTSMIKQSGYKRLGLSEGANAFSKALGFLEDIKPTSALGYMAVLGLAGATIGTVNTEIFHREERMTSMLGYTYEDWLNEQEGMASTGVAKALRKHNTDFGSPYRGPVVSNEVFENQRLMQEREKYLRAQYHVRHYDPINGLFGMYSVFSLSNKGNSYLNEGQSVDNGYYSMQGKKLMNLNIKDGWSVSAEDADTIHIKRSGMIGAISSFFGMNQGYSVRLAGIDAPEVEHESKMISWMKEQLPGYNKNKESQPYGEEAKARLQALLDNSKNIEVVYDAANVSYGRSMGAIIADGQNLNLKMVKEGTVAHLPYGNPEEAMVDYNVYKKAETQAYETRKGMWQTPWAQSIYQATINGNRPTFNTLADLSKVAQSSELMSLYSISKKAQEKGELTIDLQNSLANLGSIKGFKDSVGPNYYSTNRNANHMSALLDNTKNWMEIRDGATQAPLLYNNDKRKLDHIMSLDSLNTTNSIWTKPTYAIIEQNKVNDRIKQNRKAMQAARQRSINSQMFLSPINHNRMY